MCLYINLQYEYKSFLTMIYIHHQDVAKSLVPFCLKNYRARFFSSCDLKLAFIISLPYLTEMALLLRF